MNRNHTELLGTAEWAAFLHEEVMPVVTHGVDLGDDLLEIGPGPGAATEWLRSRVQRLVALELEPEAAAALGKRFAGTNVEAAVGDATALPYPDESFDTVGFAATADEMLPSSVGSDIEESGNERRWAAVPTVAHNTEFKAQQAERLSAARAGRTRPAFADIDHASAAVYKTYSAPSADTVIAGSRQVTASLLDGVRALTDEDLLEPGRHPWLNGRTLWLQIIVRGLWHPTGHIADYYLRHGRPGQAVALQKHAVATARYLEAPDQAIGMAAYSLACAQAQARLTDEAGRALAEAITLNSDVRENARRDPDLAPLRETGQLAEILSRG